MKDGGETARTIDSIYQPKPQQAEEKLVDEHALEAELKYIQYLPANIGEKGITIDSAIKSLYKTRHTNVN
jgi:hypothetical protein